MEANIVFFMTYALTAASYKNPCFFLTFGFLKIFQFIIMKKIILFCLVLFSVSSLQAQKVKNVIYMIGDGMGLTHLTAATLASGAPLAIHRAQYVGLQTTWPSTGGVTDSAASGTALATGVKTTNGSIGVDPNGNPLENIREKSEKAGKATGVVATYSVTHATPAAFMAHDVSRSNEYDIAADFMDTKVDLFIGGGLTPFEKRKDGRNLSRELRDRGYNIFYSLDDLKSIEKGKAGVLLADWGLPRHSAGRGDMLPRATEHALRILSNSSPEGFFIMIEGSQIDGGGHDNNGNEVVSELIDFDNAVRVAMDFADRNPGTLVIVTADHETGGMSLPESDGKAVHKFSTGGHTATMVPIYAYGAGAESFTGIMDNTDIPKKIMELSGLK